MAKQQRVGGRVLVAWCVVPLSIGGVVWLVDAAGWWGVGVWLVWCGVGVLLPVPRVRRTSRRRTATRTGRKPAARVGPSPAVWGPPVRTVVDAAQLDAWAADEAAALGMAWKPKRTAWTADDYRNRIR